MRTKWTRTKWMAALNVQMARRHRKVVRTSSRDWPLLGDYHILNMRTGAVELANLSAADVGPFPTLTHTRNPHVRPDSAR